MVIDTQLTRKAAVFIGNGVWGSHAPCPLALEQLEHQLQIARRDDRVPAARVAQVALQLVDPRPLLVREEVQHVEHAGSRAAAAAAAAAAGRAPRGTKSAALRSSARCTIGEGPSRREVGEVPEGEDVRCAPEAEVKHLREVVEFRRAEDDLDAARRSRCRWAKTTSPAMRRSGGGDDVEPALASLPGSQGPPTIALAGVRAPPSGYGDHGRRKHMRVLTCPNCAAASPGGEGGLVFGKGDVRRQAALRLRPSHRRLCLRGYKDRISERVPPRSGRVRTVKWVPPMSLFGMPSNEGGGLRYRKRVYQWYTTPPGWHLGSAVTARGN
ncbi:hypothetical protein GGX14DRAFT_403595 [Mycena pura]|uniref:Uncharacterized protein n=1 Tax=Mycena pura TaxID=153505 RepID=A0AAD6UXT3_9AGAR|nr:hypothetical protein GGX14DRAFT_403595 [Mycena pura]